MGGKRDIWQQITSEVKSSAAIGDKNLVFSPASGRQAVHAAEAARRIAAGIQEQASSLNIQGSEFGNPGNLAGTRLRDAFVDQQTRLNDVLKKYTTSFEHIGDMFGYASRLYRDRDRESAAGFRFDDAILSEFDDYRISDDDALSESAAGEFEGDAARGAKGETVDPGVVGEDGATAVGAVQSPPPASSMLPVPLARLGQSIDTSTIRATAVEWIRMSRQVERLAYYFAQDLNKAFDEWSGVGQRAAKAAGELYIKNLNALYPRMEVMGRVLADTEGWLSATRKNMPVDGVRDRVNTALISSNTIWTVYRTNDGDRDELAEIQENYEKYYLKPMTATQVPVIPDFAKAVSAGPKNGPGGKKNPGRGDKNDGAAPAGPQAGPASAPQNGNPGPTGQTDKLKQGFEKLDAAQKNLQKNVDKIEQGAQRIKDGQTNIGQGAQLISQGNQLMQQAQQARAAGRTREADALMAQGRRLIGEGKDKVAEGRTKVTAGQRDMKAALTEIENKDAKAIARAEKALREAGQALPAEQRKSVDQAIEKSEKFRESTTGQAEKLTKDFTEAGDQLLKDSKDLLDNPGTADPAATLVPGSTTDPAPAPTQPVPAADPGTTPPPELAAAAQPPNTAVPNTSGPGPASTDPSGSNTPVDAVPAPGATTPGFAGPDTTPLNPAATPQAGPATPVAGQDPLSRLAGVAQQMGSFVQQAGQGLTNLFQAGAVPNMPLPGMPDIPAALRDLAAGAPPGGLGGGGSPGAGPAGVPGQPLEPPREYGPKLPAREAGTPVTGVEPRAGVPAAHQQPMMGSPGVPGAGAGTGQGGQDSEHKRPKFLQSTEHLEEALGEAPAVYKAVIDR